MTLRLRNVTLPATLTYPKLSSFELFSVMATCPVQAGLVGSYFLGSRNVQPTYNFANAGLPLLQVGTPDFEDAYALCSKNKGYFDTQLKSTTEMTIFAISVVSGAGNLVQVVSNMKTVGGLQYGDSLFSTTGSALGYAQQNGGIVGVAQPSADSADGDFKISAMAVTNTPSVIALYMDPAGALSYSANNLGAARTIAPDNLMIGAAADTADLLRDSAVTAVLIFNRAVPKTTGETEAIMNWLRNVVMPQAGISQ